MVYLFRKQGYELCRLFCKSLEKSKKHGLALLNLFGNEDAAYYVFVTFMFMPVVPAIDFL